MTRVLLIYPYFKPRRDRSVFRFPPLGVSYLASSLLAAGHEVHLLDCTFKSRDQAIKQAVDFGAEVVGIYCMVTMLDDCLWFARQLRGSARLLIAGGPLPTCDPEAFVDDFDVAVVGEGESTLLELVAAYSTGRSLASIPGIVLLDPSTPPGAKPEVLHTPTRPFEHYLDTLPFPARQLLPNQDYIQFGWKKYGYAITSLMSTRGCPYECEFCSNVIFGGSYRERSAANVVDEVEQALSFGYDRISFADDVFTINQKRVLEICAEIQKRKLDFKWECLARVDSVSSESTYTRMFQAGCRRVYFGIESGDDTILKLMNKRITSQQAHHAVEAAHQAGLEVGAFFILFYPGETDQTVLNTLHFASTLPLDYIGLTMPYPLPGTALYERVKGQIKREWDPNESIFGSHVLIYNGDFSAAKMWFGIFKGKAQFEMRRRLGRIAPTAMKVFEPLTDWLLMRMR